MEKILKLLSNLKNSDIKPVVDSRLKSFEKLGQKPTDDIFSELCFCLLTANFRADKSIAIQQSIGYDFCRMREKSLAKKLKELGHRFPNTRAKFIREAQHHRRTLKSTMNEIGNEQSIRDWLVKNVKGLGMKEASHFMRNIGYKNLAIIDFHIIDILAKHKLIKEPKTLTKKKYLEIEHVLESVAKKAGMSLAELDLYLWHAETGKVLK